MANFSINKAIEYGEKGIIEDWVHNFLSTVGNNNELSLEIRKQKRYWVGPIKIPLDNMMRRVGWEVNLEFPELYSKFEKNMSEMINKVENGWEVLPLLLEYKPKVNSNFSNSSIMDMDKKFIIRDGNRRYEVLKRMKVKEYWSIIWYNNINDLLLNSLIKPSIFFITGTSGSGKSQMLNHLKEFDLDFVTIHDYDEGEFSNEDKDIWRRQRINEWLELADNYKKQGKSTIICAIASPQEVKECPSYREDMNIQYGLIHIGESEIIRRLESRNWEKELINYYINLAERLKQAVSNEKASLIVDGQNNSSQQVTDRILNWILQKIIKNT